MATSARKDPKDKVRLPSKGFMLWQQFAKVLPLINPKLKLTIDGAIVMSEDGDGMYAKLGDGAAFAASNFVMYCIIGEEVATATTSVSQTINTGTGTSVHLVVACLIGTGSFDLVYTWDKDGAPVGSDVPRYKAIISTEDDAGLYTCTIQYGEDPEVDIAVIQCQINVS